MPQVTNLGTSLVKELCWERTSTHTCAVSLHDTIYITYLVRTDAQSDASSCANSVGRSDKRIRTEVYIKHGSLSTFAKNILARTQHLVDFHLAVYHTELLQIFDAFHPGLLYFCDIEISITERSYLLEVLCLMSLILSLEVIQNVANTQTSTAHLIGISRTNALACSSHLVLTLRGFDGSIEHTMSRHDEMCFFRDIETALQVVTALLKILGLLHEKVWSQYHTITNDVYLATLKNT